MKPPENPPNAGKTAHGQGERPPAFSAGSAGSRTAEGVGQPETSGPTLYEALLTKAIENAHNAALELFDSEVVSMRGNLEYQLRGILSHAYTEGLRDGFVQGVAATTDQEARS